MIYTLKNQATGWRLIFSSGLPEDWENGLKKKRFMFQANAIFIYHEINFG